MKTPKTTKAYFKLLIQIARDSSYELKDATPEERKLIGGIRGDIQNELGENNEILEKRGLKWNG